MQYRVCTCCGLALPLSVMSPIKVNCKGKLIVVGICDNCKKKKIEQSKKD